MQRLRWRCLKYRPDFLIDCNTYFLIIECDEFAHQQYDKECEITRMNNISMGLGLPVKWIRFNPDKDFISKNVKHKILIDTIKSYMNLDFLENLDIIYLFY